MPGLITDHSTSCNAELTTGDVARLAGVAPRTATKWIDSGLLPGWKLPGSRDRRVARVTLIAFLRSNNMPVPFELESASRGWHRLGDKSPPAGHRLRVVRAQSKNPTESHLIATSEEQWQADTGTLLAQHPNDWWQYIDLPEGLQS